MRKLFILLLVVFFLFSSVVLAEAYEDDPVPMETAKGQVVEVISEVDPNQFQDKENPFAFVYQVVKVKVLTGKYKNEEFMLENALSNNPAFDVKVSDGDKVVLAVEETEEGIPNIAIVSFQRDNYLFFILMIFIILLIVIGRLKGVKSIVTLAVTGLVILKFMLPLILKGYNPIWVSIVASIIITVVTLFVIAGFNIKSVSAILGTAGGVILAGFLAYFVGVGANLTGLSSHEANMLPYIPQNITFDYRGLLFAGIIIGTLGAVMDVAMSIASSMFEMRKIHPEIMPKELMKSGLNVGRDVMGTMSNTLILAYTGSAIPLLLLFMAYQRPLVDILNLDLMATEIVRAIAGSIGIIIAIPITAAVTGVILKYRKVRD